jgi:GAF domain-containing protein
VTSQGLTDEVWALVAAEDARPDDQPHVFGALQRLCRAATRSLGASGVAVSLMAEDGAQVTGAASDPPSARVSDLQLTLGEGPCLDAYTSGTPVLVADLGGATSARWLGYAPAAQELGVRSVFSFPLQMGAARLGALNVYRGTAGSLSRQSFALCLGFAEVAMSMLLDAQQQAAVGASAPALDDVGDSRFELYQAQGMVTVQLDVDLGVAMARLRAYAYAHDLRVTDVAHDIVARTLVLEEDDA